MAAEAVRRFRAFLRANFIAGVFVALPLGITVVALIWAWKQIDGPLKSIFQATEKSGAPWERLFKSIAGRPEYESIVVPLLGLLVLLLAVLVLGVIIRSILGRFMLGVFEGILIRVPLAGTLYQSIKQLAVAFMDEKGKSKFQKAVLVQFPIRGSWVIGFETSTAIEPLVQASMSGENPDEKVDVITVFVPTTPLPTQGFTLVLPRKETRELPMSVEQAIKLVISGGILTEGNETSKGEPAITK